MATLYPTQIDNLTDPNGSTSLYTNNHSALHKNENDAIEAVQAKVGKNGDTNTSSHDYKLSTVSGVNKAESQGNKGIANGYAPLDTNARISQDYLPTVIMSAESTGTPNEIGDTVALPSGDTVSYSDVDKTVTITSANGSKRVFSETGLKEYGSTASGGTLFATSAMTGVYSVATHSITYSNEVSVSGTTGAINNDNSTFAYTNKANTFTEVNRFDNDIILNGRVSTPYNPIVVVSGALTVDGKVGHCQKVTIDGTSAITLRMINASPGQYTLSINKTGGTASITTPAHGSKATGGTSNTATIGDTSSDNSLLGFYESSNSGLPATLANGVHKFVFDVQEFAVHIIYLGTFIARV